MENAVAVAHTHSLFAPCPCGPTNSNGLRDLIRTFGLLLSGLIVIYTTLLEDLQTILLVGSEIIMHIYCLVHGMQNAVRLNEWREK